MNQNKILIIKKIIGSDNQPKYQMPNLLIHELFYPSQSQFISLIKQNVIVKNNGFRFSDDISIEMFKNLQEIFKKNYINIETKIIQPMEKWNLIPIILTIEEEKKEMEKWIYKELYEKAMKGIIVMPNYQFGRIPSWCRLDKDKFRFFTSKIFIDFITNRQESHYTNKKLEVNDYFEMLMREVRNYVFDFQIPIIKEQIIPEAMKLAGELNKIVIKRDSGSCHLLPKRKLSYTEEGIIKSALTIEYYVKDDYGGLSLKSYKAYRNCKNHKHCLTFSISLIDKLMNEIKTKCPYLNVVFEIVEEKEISEEVKMKCNIKLRPFQVNAVCNWLIGEDLIESKKKLLFIKDLKEKERERNRIENLTKMYNELYYLVKEVQNLSQSEAHNKMIEIFNKYNFDSTAGRKGTLAIFTRGGKSFIAYVILYLMQIPTLIVLRTEELQNQFKREIKTLLNIKESDIGEYYGKKKELKAITIGIYNSFVNLLDGDNYETMVEKRDECIKYFLEYIFHIYTKQRIYDENTKQYLIKKVKRKDSDLPKIIDKVDVDNPNYNGKRGQRKKIKEEKELTREQIFELYNTLDYKIKFVDYIKGKFELLIIDECHHLPAETFKTIAIEMSSLYRLGLSATPERQDRNEALLYATIGSLLFRGTHKDLLRDNLNCPVIYEKRYVELSNTEPRILNTERIKENYPTEKFGYNKEVELWEATKGQAHGESMKHYKRAEIICYTATNKAKEIISILEKHRDRRAIIYTMYQFHAKEIKNKLIKFAHKIYEMLSSTDMRETVFALWKKGKLNILVTAKVLDEGITVPDAEVEIIASGTGNLGQMIQRIGRTLGYKRGKIAYIYEIVCVGTLDTEREGRRDVEQYYNQYEGYEDEIRKALWDRIIYSFVTSIDKMIQKEMKNEKNVFETITKFREGVARLKCDFKNMFKSVELYYQKEKEKEIKQLPLQEQVELQKKQQQNIQTQSIQAIVINQNDQKPIMNTSNKLKNEEYRLKPSPFNIKKLPADEKVKLLSGLDQLKQEQEQKEEIQSKEKSEIIQKLEDELNKELKTNETSVSIEVKSDDELEEKFNKLKKLKELSWITEVHKTKFGSFSNCPKQCNDDCSYIDYLNTKIIPSTIIDEAKRLSLGNVFKIYGSNGTSYTYYKPTEQAIEFLYNYYINSLTLKEREEEEEME